VGNGKQGKRRRKEKWLWPWPIGIPRFIAEGRPPRRSSIGKPVSNRTFGIGEKSRGNTQTPRFIMMCSSSIARFCVKGTLLSSSN
jgi:hypothetical protein